MYGKFKAFIVQFGINDNIVQLEIGDATTCGVGDEDVHSFMNEEKATEFVEKHFEALNKHKNAAWIILKEPISKDEDPEPLNVRFKNE